MALESPPWATQAGSFSAEQTRRAVLATYARTSANNPGIISGGLLSATDCQLSAAASGLVVNISTGEAIVPGNEGGAQGGYYARISSTTSVTLATANATNPRIDLICLTVGDAGYTLPSGATSGAVTAQGVTGTPTSGESLTNLSGAPTLPASSLLLGYVLVPAAATGLTSADIANKATVVQTLNSTCGTVSMGVNSGSTEFGTTGIYLNTWTGVVVNHGLSGTPTVVIPSVQSAQNSYSPFITAIGSTSFTMNLSAITSYTSVGAATCGWLARL